MLYRSYTETKTIATAVTWGAAKQTLPILKISQSKRRLEGVIVEFIYTTAGTAPTCTSDGFFNIANEIRLRVNDIIGSRCVVQCPSAVLLGVDRDMGAKLNRHNAFSQRPQVAAKNYHVFVPVLVRPPSYSEPIGNILGIPLDQLNEDMSLEIDLAPNSDCATANPSVAVAYVRATMIYRDVPSAVKYIPSELVTSKNQLLATGKQSFNISNGGYVTDITLDMYSTFGTVRSSLYTTYDHELQVNYGSVGVRRYFPAHMDCLIDRIVGMNPSSTPYFSELNAIDTSATDVAFTGPLLGHYAFDFLFDDTFGGAISPASILNANTIALGGDIIQVTGTNFTTAGMILTTTRKLLTRAPADLQALIGA